MTGSTLKVAGVLQRVKNSREDMLVEGFQGDIGVELKTYAFNAFGSYRGVTQSNGERFVSLMVYGNVQGSILKTPYVEIRGISGGFGLGSQIVPPPINQIRGFHLLMEPSVDPISAFTRLQGTSSQARHMTETNGASWVAAGVLGTACETVDVSAFLMLPLDPDAGQISMWARHQLGYLKKVPLSRHWHRSICPSAAPSTLPMGRSDRRGIILNTEGLYLDWRLFCRCLV
jgi:hypothetical protein